MDYMPHIAYNSHSPLADPRLHQHRNNNGLSFESQEYDQKMASIINATMEQGFKGDLNHVDHWFRLLSDTEQLAAVYTLLQHMSKDNARFFTKVLKQMSGDFESSSPAGYLQHQQQAFASRRLSHPVAAFSTTTTNINNNNKLGNDVLGDHRLYHPLMSSDLFGGSSIIPPSSSTTTTTNNGRPRSVIEGSGYLLRGGSTAWGGGGDLGIQPSIAAAGSASMSSSSSGARSSVGSIGDRRPRPQSVDISAWTKRPDLTLAMGGRDEKKNTKSSHSPLPSSSSLDKNHDASSTSSSSSSSQRGGGGGGGSSTTSASNSVTSSNNNKKPAEPSTIDLKELEDIPGWFRRLRLHKYTSLFEKLDWKEIVKMDDAQLEARGVAALGARRKMLKTFERVRAHCDAKDIEY
ncbi:hypothetical protein O0I10_002247 [Lichtheimia ornata]|uniref:SAM domain-containing protein n=1 Tax=Lichtheimia ornata TaxID=688661 RepID=A0AAD7VCW0_9FUNG|nr:uncharacterized protein O0I10_002247 [Lichtheimia ornata]KAJ8661916.1 hypothetical protein O0I10_002247 [Lichtheimia ornata]